MPAFILLFLVAFCVLNVAAQPEVPYVFEVGQVADPLAVNTNFDVLEADIYSNTLRISDLEVEVDGFGTDNLSNTLLGFDTLSSITTGSGNSAFGTRALLSNTEGVGNLAAGLDALRDNQTGNQNVGLGWNSMIFNVSGEKNIAVGFSALASNVDGSENVAIGWETMNDNVSASDNLAIGNQAMRLFTEGTENTAVGHEALYFNSTPGNGNTAIGYQSQGSTVGGQFNTSLGVRSLQGNNSAINTALGAEAMAAASGGSNTAVGAYAARDFAGGSNVAIGRDSLKNGDGNFNVAIGSSAGFDLFVVEALDNTIAIGKQAKVDASDTIQLGNIDITDLFIGRRSGQSGSVKANINTLGKLTTGSVTYPNTHGTAGYVLTTNGSGELVWAAPPTASNQALEELEERVASLQKQLQNQKEELLAVVQSQQEQIAQLQRIVEHQFAAR